MTCFQKGILKLQPENSQVNSTFTQTVKVLKRFTLINPRKVGFPHNDHNRDHCSLFSIADTTCNGGISESKLIRKTNLPFITLEIKNIQFSVFLGKAFTLILAVNYMYVLGNHTTCQTKGQGINEKNVNKKCCYCIFSLSETACVSVFPFVKGFDYNPLDFSVRKLEVLFMILMRCLEVA